MPTLPLWRWRILHSDGVHAASLSHRERHVCAAISLCGSLFLCFRRRANLRWQFGISAHSSGWETADLRAAREPTMRTADGALLETGAIATARGCDGMAGDTADIHGSSNPRSSVARCRDHFFTAAGERARAAWRRGARVVALICLMTAVSWPLSAERRRGGRRSAFILGRREVVAALRVDPRSVRRRQCVVRCVLLGVPVDAACGNLGEDFYLCGASRSQPFRRPAAR